ncbi:MAG TPA: endonuclease III [Clostridiales bacterium UBA8960]|nr:endonuclease III [Clostridiales bacterium UBA8960]
MTKKTIKEIINILETLYPDAKAELDFNTPFELLIAVILSAQCTDVRVNQVTKVLFEIGNTPEKLAGLPLEKIEEIIKPCGLYKTKANNIKTTAEIIVTSFNGVVPSSHEALMTLPGVGRKTANVVVSNAFDTPAIAVDTHVFRVSNRIGLANAKTVDETEVQLMKGIDRQLWTKAHHMIIFHGRRICKARSPLCGECPIRPYCKYFKKLSRESKS